MSISNCPCNKCTAASFPFFSVGNFEYKMLSSCSFLTNSNDSCITYDDYFSTTKFSELTSTLKNDDFYVVHFNARSLSKNLNKIEEFLCDMSRFPDVVAISETKLNTSSTSNINISNYNFSVKTRILVQVVLGFISKTQCNFKCVMTCRLICLTVRTYGCRLTVNLQILFLESYIATPIKKYYLFKVHFTTH